MKKEMQLTKAANVFDKFKNSAETFIDNRVEDALYLKYLMEHKYNVLKGGLELGAPVLPLVMHDWSKFKPKNWVPYREHFFGQNTKQVQKDFRKAVDDHVTSEEHHDYKYHNPDHNIKPTGENKADWWAVQRYYYPDSTPTHIKDWLKQRNSKKNLT